jgi:hypothetical protein
VTTKAAVAGDPPKRAVEYAFASDTSGSAERTRSEASINIGCSERRNARPLGAPARVC